MAVKRATLEEMIKLRAAGLSYQSIGDRYGVSKQAVYSRIHCFQGELKDAGVEPKEISEIELARARKRLGKVYQNYPVLAEWIARNCRGNLSGFARNVGLEYDAVSAALYGRRRMDLSLIRKILAYTGLTFEEAFKSQKGGDERAEDKDGKSDKRAKARPGV